MSGRMLRLLGRTGSVFPLFHVKHFAQMDQKDRKNMPKIIAVANQKGGVGKTTTAVNLAASLAKNGRSTLIVDCDPQGNASSGLGVRPAPKTPSLYTFLMEEPYTAPIHHPLAPKLDLAVIPSNSDLATAEWELFNAEKSELVLKSRLKSIGERYEYVILDCPPSLGLLTINSLIAAQTVLIPLQCEYYAMEGLTLLLETIRKIKLRFNPGLSIEGILLTMFDRRNNLAHQVANEIRGHLQFRVFKTFVPRNVRLSESPSYGLPAVLYDAHCTGTKAYLNLADEILNNGALAA